MQFFVRIIAIDYSGASTSTAIMPDLLVTDYQFSRQAQTAGYSL